MSSSTKIILSSRIPHVSGVVPLFFLMLTFPSITSLQYIAAIIGGFVSLLGAVRLTSNWSPLVDWFKSRARLISERDAAFARVLESAQHVKEARQTVDLMRDALSALQATAVDSQARIHRLEAQRPLFDAFVSWVPLVLEYVVWIEQLAKAGGLDLSGREMPPLPAALAKHAEEEHYRYYDQ